MIHRRLVVALLCVSSIFFRNVIYLRVRVPTVESRITATDRLEASTAPPTCGTLRVYLHTGYPISSH